MTLMKRNRLIYLIAGMLLTGLLAACGGGESAEESPTAEPAVETVVVVATPTPDDTAAESEAAPEEAEEETAVSEDTPVLEAPTAAPGEPTVTALVDLNIRTGPGTNYQPVGALRANSSARIIGRSSGGHWWKIECPAGIGPECWVSAGAQYSQATDADGVAVAAAPPPPPTPTKAATATPTATGTTVTDGTPTATATLANTTATPTATPPTNATATATATLAADEPTATATPTATPTATTAVQVAPLDNDSLQNPATAVFLSPTGTRNFTYSNDISYEEGDQEDWVEFEFPNNANTDQTVWLTLACTIATENDDVRIIATVWEDGTQTNQRAFCNDGEQQLTVDNTKVQQVRIHFIVPHPAYVSYTLTVVGFK